MRIASLLLAIAVSSAAIPIHLEEALNLRRQGKLQQAGALLKTTAAELRDSGDNQNLAKAVGVASEVALSVGDFQAAIAYSTEEASLRRQLDDQPGLAEAHNTLGLAHLYLSEYPLALVSYQNALDIDRKTGDREGQNIRLNNIGNIYYFEGRYLDALNVYNQAFAIVEKAVTSTWGPQRKQVTITNLAALYQRLGKEQNALALYQQVGKNSQTLSAKEQGQLLLNQGALYRRMGDPIKAIALYKTAQALFATEHHPDGEIGAQRNIGIAQAVDLNDLPAALNSFSSAIQLARQVSNNRALAQASLYRAEVLRRLHRLTQAEADAHVAIDRAKAAGLKEEQWKGLFTLGRIAEDAGHQALALDCFHQAISIIESVRENLQRVTLRSEFLADKREVYDFLIALQLQQEPLPVAEIFSWLERSRARTLRDRLASKAQPSVASIQTKLTADTLLVEYWIGADQAFALWITNSAIGIQPINLTTQQISDFNDTAQNPAKDWRPSSRSLGNLLLAGLPLKKHLIVVPDGILSTLPFEALTAPGSNALLIERSDITYLPAAQLLLRPAPSAEYWLTPWARQLVAFGDPMVPAGETLLGAELLPRLPASAGEIRSIAAMLSGRSELHLGTDAQKSYLINGKLRNTPLLHFSTHGIADTENPERSRLLLASDFMFQEEVYNLDLTGTGLVTISACDTGRGKFVRGEGVEAFPRAFLAAGAASTITSLWRVADAPTAEFMKQLYYFLDQGQSKAEALQSAKLVFLRSNGSLANPRHWAAFVLNGEGDRPALRAVPWSFILIFAAVLLAAAGTVIWRYSVRTA